MKSVLSIIILSLAASVHAAGTFQIPAAAKKMRLAVPVGQAPVETKIKLIETLETFRLTSSKVALDGVNYHIAMQTMRDGQWAVSLVPEGKKKWDLAASFPYRALRHTGGYDQEIGGKTYKVSLAESQGVEAMVFTSETGHTSAVSVAFIKQAVWDAAAPVPALGPQWRFVFQIDLWIGAGMRTFAFLEKTNNGVVFHSIRAESVDFVPRARVKKVGSRKVSLVIDDEGTIVIKPEK